jgi:hypothetical protein
MQFVFLVTFLVQGFQFRGDDIQRKVNLLGGMGAIDKKAQTGGIVRNGRIDHGQGIYSLPEEGLRESYRLYGIPDDHWNDGGTAAALAGIETSFPSQPEKKT